MAKAHVPIGVSASLLTVNMLNISLGIDFILVAGLASILADVDCPTAKINQKILPFKNKLGKFLIYGALAYVALKLYLQNPTKTLLLLLVPIFAIIAISKHRGITHKPVVCAMLTFLVYLFSPYLSIAFGIGYGLHLAADRIAKYIPRVIEDLIALCAWAACIFLII